MILENTKQVETIEVEITGLKDRYFLPKSKVLEGKNILYCLLQNASQVAAPAYAPSGRELIDSSAYDDGFLVLINKNKEFINKIPLDLLLTGTIEFATLINSEVDIPKSYIEFSSQSNLSVGESIIISFLIGKVDETNDFLNASFGVENIENVVTTNSQQKFKFDSLELLKNKKVSLIRYIHLPSINGRTTVLSKIIQKAYLTLVDKTNRVIVEKMPINLLNHTNSIVIPFADIEIDWSNSFIEVGNTTDLVADTAFSFLVYYANETANPGNGRGNGRGHFNRKRKLRR